MRHLSILAAWLLLFPLSLHAQLPPACAAGSSSVTCATACINCNFNGFSGSTVGFPSGIVPNFCGTVENAQWLGFIAGSATAEFTIQPSNCTDGNGVQVALYEDCMGMPLDCEKGQMGGGSMPVSITAPLTPGRNYFLMIDGYAGDNCDFQVTVTPNSAVYQPPLGNIGAIEGPTAVCSGATFTYSVPPVSGASAYIWTGPAGAMIDTVLLPVTLVGANANRVQITFGTTGGQICAQAANSCETNAPCASSLNISILPDSERPDFIGDTLANLACSDAPISLNLQIQPAANYLYQWTTDSTGQITSGADQLQPKIAVTGRYTLVATNTQNGCSSAISIQVGEPEPPSGAVLLVSPVKCYGLKDGSLRIDSVRNGAAPYVYALDNTPFLPDTYYARLEPGEHHLTIEAADGCLWDSTFMVEEPNELLLDLGPDTTLLLGNTIKLWEPEFLNEPWRNDSLIGFPAQFSPYLCDTCPYSPTVSFRYAVTVMDSNGCTANDERLITVVKNRQIFAPNVFAPEGKGGNERFTLFSGPDVDEIVWMRIFDRWGQMIFENTTFAPDELSEGWDGRGKNREFTPGVYVWQAEIRFKDGEKQVRSGDVVVYR